MIPIEKSDARIIRTKQLLYNALITLMNDKGFEAITIYDLTQKAGLNRGTFYLHYRDKFDLIDQIKHERLAELQNIYLSFSPKSLAEHQSMDEPHPTIQKIFQYFSSYSDFFRVMLGPKGDPAFTAQIKDLMRCQLSERFSFDQTETEKMMAPLEILIAYVTSANLGVIQYWLESGQSYSANDMAILLTRIGKLGPIQTTGLS